MRLLPKLAAAAQVVKKQKKQEESARKKQEGAEETGGKCSDENLIIRCSGCALHCKTESETRSEVEYTNITQKLNTKFNEIKIVLGKKISSNNKVQISLYSVGQTYEYVIPDSKCTYSKQKM